MLWNKPTWENILKIKWPEIACLSPMKLYFILNDLSTESTIRWEKKDRMRIMTSLWTASVDSLKAMLFERDKNILL